MSAVASSSEGCPLCERPVPVTKHHVKLRRRDRHAKVLVCAACQQVIHGLYPGTILARRPDLWTIAGLKADPAIAKALVFVRKVPPGGRMRMRERR
jgi:hypothetical protein